MSLTVMEECYLLGKYFLEYVAVVLQVIEMFQAQ